MFQYLLTPPDRLSDVEAFRLPPIHLAFHIGPDGGLHGAAKEENENNDDKAERAKRYHDAV